MFWFSEDNKKVETKFTKEDELQQLVWNFFMNKIPKLGFEQREGQEDMALDICNAIAYKEHTIVEAGVGIGKSYAYIVPLLYYNKLFNKPVLIATSTIALQEQLIKDVKRVCSYINHKPEIVLAKGMTHFACKSRADKYFKSIHTSNFNDDLETLCNYINNGVVDRKNIKLDVNNNVWDNVNVKSTDHNKCEHYNSCSFMSLRRDMLNTEGIILCNQDLLTVHLQKLKKGQKGLLNEKIDLIVIDEAHNLEEKVRSSLIESYNKYRIKSILRDIIETIKISTIRNESYEIFKGISDGLDVIFYKLSNQIKKQINSSPKGEDMEKFFINIDEIREELLVLNKKINLINDKVQFYSDDNLCEEMVEDLENLKGFIKSLIDINSKNLFWLEKSKDVHIFACPKNISKEINLLYLDQLKTTIFTSATIADKNQGSEQKRYEYFIRNTGFPVDLGFLSMPKPSPFPYDDNAMIYYTENMPHPVEERSKFIKYGTDEIVKLLNITKGKALILFTAKSDLNEVYEMLKHKSLSYKILKQQHMSSQDDILEEFKKDENSVLLATGTFWEGIDVPGNALSNLIIFKLPFPVPDPIIEYKRTLSKDFLMEVSVPLMIVKLRQGVGRLIRKHDDKGIVAILDSRIGELSSKPYKEMVFDSLPIKNKTNDINKLKCFWMKMDRERLNKI